MSTLGDFESTQTSLQSSVLKLAKRLQLVKSSFDKLDMNDDEIKQYYEIVNNRYLSHYCKEGSSLVEDAQKLRKSVGPRILISGSTKQGKSTLMQVMMRIILGDGSFDILQRANQNHLQVRYGNKLSDYIKQETVEVKFENGVSVHTSLERLAALVDDDVPVDEENKNERIVEVTVMPEDNLHRLLTAALLVETKVSTSWKATFALHKDYSGNNAKVEIELKTAAEMEEYKQQRKRYSLQQLKNDENSAELEAIERDQDEMDAKMIPRLFHMTEYPSERKTYTITRQAMGSSAADDDSKTLFIELVVNHKHFIKEIRWYDAPDPQYSKLSGVTFLDSPGYEHDNRKDAQDPNSAITFDEKDKTVFHNIVTRIDTPIMTNYVEQVFPAIFSQKNIIDELKLNRFFFSITAIENLVTALRDGQQGAMAPLHAKSILGELGGKIFTYMITQIQSSIESLMQKHDIGTITSVERETLESLQALANVNTQAVPPMMFLSGAKQDQYRDAFPLYNLWNINNRQEETQEVLASFKDMNFWQVKQKDLITNNWHDMVQKFYRGSAVRYQVEEMNRVGQWLCFCFFKQFYHDYSGYLNKIKSKISDVLDQEQVSSLEQWDALVGFAKREKRRLQAIKIQNGGIKIKTDIDIEWDKNAGELFDELRNLLRAQKFMLTDGKDAAYYPALIDKLGVLRSQTTAFRDLNSIWDHLVASLEIETQKSELLGIKHTMKEHWHLHTRTYARNINTYIMEKLITGLDKIEIINAKLQNAELVPSKKFSFIQLEVSRLLSISEHQFRHWLTEMYLVVTNCNVDEEERLKVERAQVVRGEIEKLEPILDDVVEHYQDMQRLVEV